MQNPGPQTNFKTVYDAIVIGSGAAGGMAAHVLTSHGLKVLLLEAGKQLNTTKELHSMEWPYDHPRRGDMPPTYHPLTVNEYNIRNPPYAQGSAYPHVESYVQGWNGADYSKNMVVDEKDHPYTGTKYAWVRSRAVGGKTNIWGRLALRLSDYDFKAKSRDGYGEDWPISYADIAPYYDKVDLYLGISGHKENLPYLPDSIFQRPVKLTAAELKLRASLAKSGRVLTPYRAGVTTDGLKHNKYRSRCFGRGACDRHVGGCDIHAAFDSPTGLIRPAMDTGNLTLRPNSIVYEITVDKNTGKARGVKFIDAETNQTYEVLGRSVILGASTLESARLLMLSKSTQHPNGLANSSGHVGHNFCEHIMGPGISGIVKDLVGKPRTIDDGRPGSFYLARFRNLADKQNKFIRGYGFEGSSGTTMLPGSAFSTLGFGTNYKKAVRDYAGAYIDMGAFGEVLARYENYVTIDPEVKDKWGIPVLQFHYNFGDNEKKMAEDMAVTAREMFEEAGIEVVKVEREILTEGWSIHELGTSRMGNDPKTSVVNQFQQAHDVPNLLVVDGSTHVSASCQNPTWTIMALCWRSCDRLADEMKKGNV
ncbi:MAG: GMC family oxidoreductase [Bryobacteraceae bacterium]